MVNYVLGFLFSPDFKKVCLIQKLKPESMLGKLNGVGGKIETTDLSIKHAMIREFKEETGVELKDWEFATTLLKHNVFRVYIFRSVSDEIYKCTSTTEERIIISDIFNPGYTTMFNIRWIIPLLMDKEVQIPTEFIYF